MCCSVIDAILASKESPRFYRNLEVLRFLAALSVVIVHFHWFADPDLPGVGKSWKLEDAAFTDFLSFVYTYGDYGVQFFWLLSGFIFFSQYAAKISQRSVSSGRFALLRFSRLYPLNIATMVAALVLQQVYSTAVNGGRGPFESDSANLFDVLRHVGFASAWGDPFNQNATLNLPVWSVSMEILAYVSFFAAMRYAPRITMLLTPSAFVAMLMVSSTPNFLIQVFVFFYAGGALYIATRFLETRMSARVKAAALAISPLLIVPFFAYVYVKTFVAGTMEHSEAGLPLSLAFVVAIVVAAVAPQVTGRAGKLAETLGNTTYASYLIHFPLMLLVITVTQLAGTPIDTGNELLLIVWLAIVFALSVLVYRFFERPAQDLIRRRLLPHKLFK